MNSQQSSPRLPLWPFFVADLVLVGAGVGLFQLAQKPLQPWVGLGLVLCAVALCISIVFPFVRRSSDSMATSQSERLADSVAEIKKLEQLATQISAATTQWQSVQEYAVKITDSAKQVGKDMDAQIKEFSGVLQKASDTEKNHLRVEIDKLRRSEMEWLQTLTRILDHVYALYLGALQSGQRNLIEQIGQFQNACRETARRMGLVPQLAAPGDVFDPNIHQLMEGEEAAQGKGTVELTLVTGFTYQGQLIRRIVVKLQGQEAKPAPAE